MFYVAGGKLAKRPERQTFDQTNFNSGKTYSDYQQLFISSPSEIEVRK